MSQGTLELIAISATAVLQFLDPGLASVLDGFSVPIYVIDANAVLVYFNPPCVSFAGRVPVIGEDRWCITHRRLGNDSAPQPYEAYPVAQALQGGRAVRGMIAIAERPDGSRVRFMPYPTPIFDGAGHVAGAVNIFVDLADRERANWLRTDAVRCRRLANSVNDEQTRTTLTRLAGERETQAEKLDPLVSH